MPQAEHTLRCQDINNSGLNDTCSIGFEKIADLLIKGGADVNGSDDDRWTPLFYTAQNIGNL